MPTVHVQAGSSADLQEIADSLFKAKKVVVITGAGISTNSGIPDFRSENGLYSMIQGQFDAAARLGAPRSDDARSGDDERPRKRRRMSASPVGDSIEVRDAAEDSELPVEGESISVKECIEADNQGLLEEVPGLKAENATGNDPIDVDLEVDPTEEEVVLLSEETVLEGEWKLDSESGFPSLKTQAQAKNEGVVFVKTQEQDRDPRPQTDKQAKEATTSSPTLPAQALPPQHPSTASFRQTQQQSLLFTSNPNPSLRIVSSPGPSTPKQSSSSSESGAQTTTLSSPLSSPPPIMSDPYEEQLANSHSSSRCTSPDSSDDAPGPSGDIQSFNYAKAFKHASLSTLKGRDLFDSSIWSDPLKTSVFYTFATNLRQKSRCAKPSGSHHFISHLRNTGKMVRCYTQNIDLLEDKVGLATHLPLGTGSRARFSARNAKAVVAANSRQDANSNDGQPAELGPTGHATVPGGSIRPALAATPQSALAPEPIHQGAATGALDVADVSRREACGSDRPLVQEATQGSGDNVQDCIVKGKEPISANSDTTTQVVGGGEVPLAGPSSPEPDRGVECVYLHGSLRALRCFQCGGVVDWDEGDRELQTMSGQQPPCPRCEDATAARQERGKRALGVGKLRPDIVLYGEEHPDSQRISDIIQHDLSLAPDMLIIMGTSLKVHGLKTVVKEFAKAVHNKKDGRVIFVNYTKPADSVWADTIDFWVQMDCDSWVHDLKEKKPLIWLPPGSVIDEPRNNKRRRRTNHDAERTTASKKTSKVENSDSTNTILLSSKPSKLSRSEAQEATKPSVTKPQPKRPAAFRDHKVNGAFLTTKIMRDLATISGRDVPKYSSMPIAAKAAPSVVVPVSTAEKPVALRQNLRKGRGPRLKNARTRMPGSKAAAIKATITSDFVDGSPQPGGDQTGVDESGNGKHHTGRVTASGHKATGSRARPPPLAEANTIDARDVVVATSMKQEPSPPTATQEETVLAELPIPNSGPGPDGKDSSILAAVKSHHRIRKPKAFFGSEPTPPPKSGRGTPVPSGAGANPKAKSASQGKKAKLPIKPIKIEQGRQPSQKQTPILPPPHPRSAMSTSTSATRDGTAPRQSSNPVESCILPPIQAQNLASHWYPAQYIERPYPPAQPPAYLEPTVVVEGPPSEMSPTTSPQHWRKRAFSFVIPQPRHFEGPCRGLDFVSMPSVSPPTEPPVAMSAPLSLAPPPAQLTEQMVKINTAPPSASRAVLFNPPFLATPETSLWDAPPGVQSISDSPNRQLQRENEAAAALSQLRTPPAFDDRRFVL
ncbi:NAD-dependent deacetylase hst3 [Cytospora paraplurivora]|uniref:NAD-dependent deacetylase hst3 n=1 Tax=Cytospora paraplurivora TaxID=2898453 RepID=A0AAN9TZJ8_9PEZI